MREIFVDTSAFYALIHKGDKHHQEAVRFFKEQVPILTPLTSNYIYLETLLLLKSRIGHHYAQKFGELVNQSKKLKVIRLSKDDDRESWKLFTRFSDQEFSYVDCTSFYLMKKLKIKKTFAFDTDFEWMGYKLLP